MYIYIYIPLSVQVYMSPRLGIDITLPLSVYLSVHPTGCPSMVPMLPSACPSSPTDLCVRSVPSVPPTVGLGPRVLQDASRHTREILKMKMLIHKQRKIPYPSEYESILLNMILINQPLYLDMPTVCTGVLVHK